MHSGGFVLWLSHMTRTSNARIAGAAFLVYIAAGLTSLALSGQATGGPGAMESRLAAIAAHPTHVGLLVLLGFVMSFSALTLAVTLYAITRDVDHDIALFGMVCRVAEGVIDGLAVAVFPALLALATATGADADPAATRVLARYLLRGDMVPATFFAVGSTAFAYLLLRGRVVPRPLAWLGVAGSVLLVILLPLQMAGWARGMVVMVMWLPMLVFELWLAGRFLVRGAPPATA